MFKQTHTTVDEFLSLFWQIDPPRNPQEFDHGSHLRASGDDLALIAITLKQVPITLSTPSNVSPAHK